MVSSSSRRASETFSQPQPRSSNRMALARRATRCSSRPSRAMLVSRARSSLLRKLRLIIDRQSSRTHPRRQPPRILTESGYSPQCAVVDINLGEGASFAGASALQNKGVPFVFVTGYDDLVIPAAFSNVPRLRKPVELRQVVRA